MATGAKSRPGMTFDANLEMKDAGLVAASAAAEVDSAAKYLDLGTGLVSGEIVVDVSAIEIASNDEAYTIMVEGANEVAFDTTLVPLAALHLGALEAIPPGSSHYKVDSAIGRYVIPFRNERDETFYRYIRLYTVVAGTVATGINYTAAAHISRG